METYTKITDKVLLAAGSKYAQPHPDIQFPTVIPKWHPTEKMVALRWYGNKDVRVEEVPRPMITDPRDAIVRTTTSTVCGSDLHLYHNEFEGLHKGDILGHESVGVVMEVGPEVKDIKVGDRVVVSAVIMCGECSYCKNMQPSLCERTNPETGLESMYGHRLSGIFGYSHLLGGYPGCQAGVIRVPIADLNLLKIPDNLRDEQVLFLSDIACTGWHANECAEVGRGDVVAIWGQGPVGLMCTHWALFRGASRVIVIDNEQYRLDFAKQKFGVETINYSELDVCKELQRLVPGGPDCCIEAAGFRFAKGVIHTVERLLRIETDAPQTLNEIIFCCKKGGRIGIIGDWYGYCNHFNIGAYMEKYLTARGSQVFVQRYWKQILQWIQEGKVDLTWCISHTMKLAEADKAYDMFDKKENNVLKLLLKP